MPNIDRVSALQPERFSRIRLWWRSMATTSPPTEPTESQMALKVVAIFSLAGLALCLYVLEQLPAVSRGLVSAWGMLS